MKLRSSSVAFILMCGLFAVASPSPISEAKKESSPKAVKEGKTEAKINPSEIGDADNNNDDLLTRAKKSSTVTTFCVEIKPGTEQPSVVLCDPAKTNQQIQIPSTIPATPPPPPSHPEPEPSYQYEPIIPDYRPSEIMPHSLAPLRHDPMIFVPDQAQIIQPQLISPFYPQPQVIIIREPCCPSNNPIITTNKLQRFYPSMNFGKSGESGAASDLYRSGYENQKGESLRTIQGSSSMSDIMAGQGYSGPMSLIYPGRGTPPQQNQNNDGSYNSPVLVQCNPSVTPLSQNAYTKALAQGAYTKGLASGKANEFALDSGMRNIGGGQSMRHYGAAGQGIYATQGGLNQQNRYHSDMYGQMQQNNMRYKTIPDFGGLGRAAEQIQAGVNKNLQEMSMQQNQAMSDSTAKNIASQQHMSVNSQSQSSLNGQENHHAASGISGDSKALNFHEQQQKLAAQKAAQEILNENSKSRFYQNDMQSDSFAKNMGRHQQQMDVNSQSSFNAQGNQQGVSGISGESRGLNIQEQQHKFSSEKGAEESVSKNSENRFYSSSFDRMKNSQISGDRMQTSLKNSDQAFQQQQQQKTAQGTSCAAGLEQSQSTGKDMSYNQMLMDRMKSAVNQGNLVQPFMTPTIAEQSHRKL